MEYYLKAARFIMEEGLREGGYLQIRNGEFGDYCETVEPQANVVDCQDCIIAPGLVDMHIHGIDGVDVMDATPEAIQKISSKLPECGVTSFMPTTLTASADEIRKSLTAIHTAYINGAAGAKIAGVFVEGPYFTEKYKGAQNPAYFKDPSCAELQEWLDCSGQLIRRIAIAPERPGSLEFIRYAREKQVFVALGHTDAGYEVCMEAVKCGANSFVHTYNGMRGLHHREPGTVGAAIVSEGTYAEIIADGHHVHPAAFQVMLKGKGADCICLVSDCMRAGAMPDGTYLLGEFAVTVKDGVATTETGSLAGSTLRLLDGVKNVLRWTKLSEPEAFHMASLNPARAIGLSQQIGSIKRGKKADFLVLDRTYQLQKTYINGERVW